MFADGERGWAADVDGLGVGGIQWLFVQCAGHIFTAAFAVSLFGSAGVLKTKLA